MKSSVVSPVGENYPKELGSGAVAVALAAAAAAGGSGWRETWAAADPQRVPLVAQIQRAVRGFVPVCLAGWWMDVMDVAGW